MLDGRDGTHSHTRNVSRILVTYHCMAADNGPRCYHATTVYKLRSTAAKGISGTNIDGKSAWGSALWSVGV